LGGAEQEFSAGETHRDEDAFVLLQEEEFENAKTRYWPRFGRQRVAVARED